MRCDPPTTACNTRCAQRVSRRCYVIDHLDAARSCVRKNAAAVFRGWGRQQQVVSTATDDRRFAVALGGDGGHVAFTTRSAWTRHHLLIRGSKLSPSGSLRKKNPGSMAPGSDIGDGIFQVQADSLRPPWRCRRMKAVVELMSSRQASTPIRLPVPPCASWSNHITQRSP